MLAGSRLVSAAILLSGGMDSTALAYWKRPDIAFTIDYGQRSAGGELRAAAAVCHDLRMPHHVLRVDCRSLGSGDLAEAPPNPFAPVPEWWPFRNQLLISLAAMRGIALGVQEMMLGCVKSDGSHVDGTEEFISIVDHLLRIQEGGLRVGAPAISMSSAELVRVSGIILPQLAWAHSCHREDYACGSCRGCHKHRNVMEELGHEPY
jgi:7-cyano-7-deazaguanine synthase